jgi:predicted AlkP superfamily pyrophosphatase or phosphodiesterase
MHLRFLATAALALAVPAAAIAQSAAPAAATAPADAPRLLVVISVDQFSADLFQAYRRDFTGGFARLMQGKVFPNAYQSHAATETCPGHSTITTGFRPARTGIIGNDWFDLKTARADKQIYCLEDESQPGTDYTRYVVSDLHLRVPTLGERMKAANPATKVYSISGKDRSAVAMGGHKVDQIWWWSQVTNSYVTYAGRPAVPLVDRTNAAVAAQIAQAQPPLDPPAYCASRDRAVDVGGGKTVGAGRFARAAGDARAYRASPAYDGATLALAAGMIVEGKLGQGATTDIITVGASGTDAVGHTYGPGGLETCLQLASLDRDLGDFFRLLDRLHVDYAVVLTADHGGGDIPERLRLAGVTGAARVDPTLAAPAMGKAVAAKLGLTGQLFWGSTFGDIWVDPALKPADRTRAIAAGVAAYRAHPQVEAVFTAEEIAATPIATTTPDKWTLLERARASYDPERSGAFVVILKPNISSVANPTGSYVSSHGSAWDYDRRVPLIFWRPGMAQAEVTRPVETVDIAPTLASMIGLPLARGTVDGKCLPEVAPCR